MTGPLLRERHRQPVPVERGFGRLTTKTAARRIADLVEQVGDGWSVRVGIGSGNRVVVAERGDRRLYATASSDEQVAALVTIAARTDSGVPRRPVREGSETR